MTVEDIDGPNALHGLFIVTPATYYCSPLAKETEVAG